MTYESYANPKINAELRRFLLKDHLSLVAKNKAPLYKKEEDIKKAIEGKKLISLDELKQAERSRGRTEQLPFYFYNVPKKYRYLRKETVDVLLLLGKSFQNLIKEKGAYQYVKFSLSSVLRPISYQEELKKHNSNTAYRSTHSYAMSFDIFYDDFFVDLPSFRESHSNEKNFEDASIEENFHKELHSFLGFLLGRAQRRQFRAVLAETLLDLQREGKLYVTWEKRQRCYHVTVVPK